MMTEAEERELRIAIMQADLMLKTRQGFWETQRNLMIILGAVVAVVATVAGLAGFRAGQRDSEPRVIIIQQQPPPAK